MYLHRFPFDRQLLQIECTLRNHWSCLPANHVKAEQWALLTGIRSRARAVTITAQSVDGWRMGISKPADGQGNGAITVAKRLKDSKDIDPIRSLPAGNHAPDEMENVWACGTETFAATEELDMDLTHNWVALVPIARIPNHYVSRAPRPYRWNCCLCTYACHLPSVPITL
jgi:hypothetical protein